MQWQLVVKWVVTGGRFFLPPFISSRIKSEDRKMKCTGYGFTVVTAVAPVASMQAIKNPVLAEVAEAIQSKLKSVIKML